MDAAELCRTLDYLVLQKTDARSLVGYLRVVDEYFHHLPRPYRVFLVETIQDRLAHYQTRGGGGG